MDRRANALRLMQAELAGMIEAQALLHSMLQAPTPFDPEVWETKRLAFANAVGLSLCTMERLRQQVENVIAEQEQGA